MRKIIHCDCDCFFAAVEMRDNPEYRGIPLAVGGSSDRRGVISTCNYEARKFGVRSAMPTKTALRLCPHLKVVPGHMAKYKEVSQQIMEIYQTVTPLIEPLSIDEAYLDVTASTMCDGNATDIAKYLRQEVEAVTGITISAGVAPNKFLAKIASDWRKPNGLFVIKPHQIERFLEALPVGRLHGVGKKTAERLQQRGIHTCLDLRGRPLSELKEQFGRFGERLYELARGIDERPVTVERVRKSVSVEHTFSQDLQSLETCLAEIPALFKALQLRFDKHRNELSISGCFVKVKFHDFTQTTMEQQSNNGAIEHFEPLMRAAWFRGAKAVRLLGVGYRLEEADNTAMTQLNLW
jgi:DNA polymerase-4